MAKPQNDLCAQRRPRSAWASSQSIQSSLCALRIAQDPRFLHAGSEDSGQTGQMPRLIRVFVVPTGPFVVFVVQWLARALNWCYMAICRHRPMPISFRIPTTMF